MSVVWKEPPPSGPRLRSNWMREVAEELRANPGRWALVWEDCPASTSTHVRQGKYAAFRPPEQFEVRGVTAGKPRGRADVYVRFVGTDDLFSEADGEVSS